MSYLIFKSAGKQFVQACSKLELPYCQKLNDAVILRSRDRLDVNDIFVCHLLQSTVSDALDILHKLVSLTSCLLHYTHVLAVKKTAVSQGGVSHQYTLNADYNES